MTEELWYEIAVKSKSCKKIRVFCHQRHIKKQRIVKWNGITTIFGTF